MSDSRGTLWRTVDSHSLFKDDIYGYMCDLNLDSLHCKPMVRMRTITVVQPMFIYQINRIMQKVTAKGKGHTLLYFSDIFVF